MLRVLIVDDVPDVGRELKMLLELSGEMDVVGAARDGAEAVRLAKELGPDVIVMDLEMPRMDGYAAARQIKAHNPAPRIVALTVHDNPVTRRRAQEAGVDDFVVKGAPLVDILQAIKERSQ